MNPVSTVKEMFSNILKNEILKASVYILYQQKIFFQIVFDSVSIGLKMWKTVQDRSSI